MKKLFFLMCIIVNFCNASETGEYDEVARNLLLLRNDCHKQIITRQLEDLFYQYVTDCRDTNRTQISRNIKKLVKELLELAPNDAKYYILKTITTYNDSFNINNPERPNFSKKFIQNLSEIAS